MRKLRWVAFHRNGLLFFLFTQLSYANYECVDSIIEATIGDRAISDFEYSTQHSLENTFLIPNAEGSAENKTQLMLASFFANNSYLAFHRATTRLLEYSRFQSEFPDDTYNYKAGFYISKADNVFRPSWLKGKAKEKGFPRKGEAGDLVNIGNAFDVASEVIHRSVISELSPEIIKKLEGAEVTGSCPCTVVTRRYTYRANARTTHLMSYASIDVTSIEGQANSKSGSALNKRFMHVVGVRTDPEAANFGTRYSHKRLRRLPVPDQTDKALKIYETASQLLQDQNTVDTAVPEATADDLLAHVDRMDAEVQENHARDPISQDTAVISKKIKSLTYQLLFGREPIKGQNQNREAFVKKAKSYDSVVYETSVLETIQHVAGSGALTKQALATKELRNPQALGTGQATQIVRVYGVKKDGTKHLLAELEFESEVGRFQSAEARVPQIIERHSLYRLNFNP